MADIKVDVAIIGAGTAGMSAYREALKHTDSILLIEGHEYGTTCARVGCMPSKLLIAPAEARHRAEYFQQFGLLGAVPEVDGKAVMQRVRRERDRFVGFDPKHKIKAYAKFKGDNLLELGDGTQVTAKTIIIATGSRPNIPEQFKAAGDRLIVSDDVFDWRDLPSSVAVIGAGVIGLELGQALHRLGVDMHLFSHSSSVGPLSDPEIMAYARQILAGEFPFHPNSEIKEIKNTGEVVSIRYIDQHGKEQAKEFEYILVATGRSANVNNLGLENTSLKLNKRGIPHYDLQSMQCGDNSIFIAGDATADIPLLHEAADEGRIAGENAGRFPDIFKRARKTGISIVFTDPQIAIAGQSYKQLKERSVDFAVGSVSFENQGRARVMLVNKGLLHVYGCKESGLLLGAEMIGPQHEHLAHLLAWCIQQRMSVSEIIQMPFYHPVIEEGLRSALRNLSAEMGMESKPPNNCIDCGVGG